MIADEVADKWEGVKSHPHTQGEIDAAMDADPDIYETYPVFCSTWGDRPNEWDHIHESRHAKRFSRCGEFYEAQIGEWYFVLGKDFD